MGSMGGCEYGAPLTARTGLGRDQIFKGASMPLPDFSVEEKFVINYVRSNAGNSNAYMWAYLI